MSADKRKSKTFMFFPCSGSLRILRVRHHFQLRNLELVLEKQSLFLIPIWLHLYTSWFWGFRKKTGAEGWKIKFFTSGMLITHLHSESLDFFLWKMKNTNKGLSLRPMWSNPGNGCTMEVLLSTPQLWILHMESHCQFGHLFMQIHHRFKHLILEGRDPRLK